MILKMIGAFLATAALSVVFEAPRKYILHAGIAGAMSWGIYLAVMEWKSNAVIATFVATAILTLISHTMAVICKAPVTMFLIPAVIPLVPGAGMYRVAYSLLYENGPAAAMYGYQTLQLAGAIAFGIFFIDVLFRNRQLLHRK
ncbi:MAG: threonine/serine exporter family protein [Lachnospiraceae bacterium]|nr:threonine/serine exporter family protein [Lachnospiraceae bacterium]